MDHCCLAHTAWKNQTGACDCVYSSKCHVTCATLALLLCDTYDLENSSTADVSFALAYAPVDNWVNVKQLPSIGCASITLAAIWGAISVVILIIYRGMRWCATTCPRAVMHRRCRTWEQANCVVKQCILILAKRKVMDLSWKQSDASLKHLCNTKKGLMCLVILGCVHTLQTVCKYPAIEAALHSNLVMFVLLFSLPSCMSATDRPEACSQNILMPRCQKSIAK